MDVVQARYEADISALCDALSRGEVPWNRPVALQGPPMLGRAGVSLRGLAAVMAWHAGERWPDRPLAWRLMRAETLASEERAAVLKLAANGGEALYVAVPDPRPRRLVDGTGRLWQIDAEKMAPKLDELLRRHAGDSSAIRSDATMICSLAAALLRPNRLNNAPGSQRPEGTWTHLRLAKVAAWAQLLADYVALRPADQTYWRIRRRNQVWTFYRLGRKDRPVVPWLQRLCRSGLIQGCLPAELRLLDPSDGALLPPERILRERIFHSLAIRRAPGVGYLAAQIPSRERWGSSWALNSTLSAAGWTISAVQGLALAEQLCSDPLPSEPGQAWRVVGRALREDLRRGGTESAIWQWEGAEPKEARACWRGVVRRHRAIAWMHPSARSRLEDLRYKDRFADEDLMKLAATLDRERGRIDPRRVFACSFPAVRVAALRRSKREAPTDELSNLLLLSSTLRGRSWEDILASAAQTTWERQARAKRHGGLRWLDIPAPPLREAQRIVGALLQTITPPQSWLTAFHAGASPTVHARAHAGARAAAHCDLRDYFGSLHPWHLEPWLGLRDGSGVNLLPDWSEEGRRALVRLVFHQRDGLPYLPQGGPSSPAVANLGGMWLDRAILHTATKRFGAGRFSYSRYADDLVLSTAEASHADRFGPEALALLDEVITAQGFATRPEKSWAWRRDHDQPLVLGGLRVPGERSGALQLERDTLRRARSALHRLRHRLDYDQDRERFFARTRGPEERSPSAAHGLLAHAYAATGDPRWLAYTSGRLARFARLMAGPLFSESLLAGWSDEVRVVREGPT